jgi:hypothetical protein
LSECYGQISVYAFGDAERQRREPPIMPSRIEDYAVIGNCETMALVRLDG